MGEFERRRRRLRPSSGAAREEQLPDGTEGHVAVPHPPRHGGLPARPESGAAGRPAGPGATGLPAEPERGAAGLPTDPEPDAGLPTELDAGAAGRPGADVSGPPAMPGTDAAGPGADRRLVGPGASAAASPSAETAAVQDPGDDTQAITGHRYPFRRPRDETAAGAERPIGRPIGGPPARRGPGARPTSGAGAGGFDDRDAERGLRGLVGSGSSQVSVGAAMRARDAARPTDADLAEAEERLVIVRRNWLPREDLPRNR